jgi:acetoin:2,6-dichlorophenolindophenol oxidoreductase subunit beta
MAYTTIVQALRETIREEMRQDPRVFCLGEDIGVFGGAYRVTEGLYEEFGPERIRDTPISEISIAGAAVGAALTGMLPICEFQFNDFFFAGMDQICNQAAKSYLMFGGQASVPVVFRAPIGASGRAAQHSQSLEALFMHVPGLKVVMPSTPYDARGLLKSAIHDPNPVIFLEHKLLYGASSPGGKAKSAVDEMKEFMTPAPEQPYSIALGQADIKRAGSDVTVVATSFMVHRCLALAKRLAEQDGLSLEIIDPRSLVPLDTQTIFASIEKTGRLVIVHEANSRCGFGAELAALAVDACFDWLDAPVKRVAALDTPMPFAPSCEAYVLPSEARIEAAIREVAQGRR